MSGSGQIVTICGSMQLYKWIARTAIEETAQGNIVLAPFPVAAPEPDLMETLEKLHLAKVAMSDRVVVVLSNTGYAGDFTYLAVLTAFSMGKEVVPRVFYMGDQAPDDVPAGRTVVITDRRGRVRTIDRLDVMNAVLARQGLDVREFHFPPPPPSPRPSGLLGLLEGGT